jgi:outer membrane protein OmpA-like peptidoglycan-associated protein
MREEAELAAQQAAAAKAEAEAARAEALQQKELLAVEADKARKSAEESDRLRQEAEKDKSELRARLLGQLNSILETRDSARGLIANMGDVLFETGKFNLRPEARERLAKVSGILLAYSGLKVAIEGHTDSVGTEDYNLQLSKQRADAVREYLVKEGVQEDVITAIGLGMSQPIAGNESADGRKKNRRVELVVSGDAIGVAAKDQERMN